MSIVVPLEVDQVRQLVATGRSWLAEHDQVPTCSHRLNAASVQV
jgi:hypothetical protein